ncbi:two-partner secretion domain-containing protein, partial [Roseomonas rosulenta]|uniref:two-partner secretion domain-containing protein n=1 Tax=Roseomonas rosulenta TaxID=2748667 RepID=UPI0018E0062E
MRRDWLLATTALLPIASGPVMAQPAPNTGPTGGQVVAGQAGITRAPGRTTITQGTDRAAIDWQQFNVGSQHTVQFVQPSQGSWTLNRVVGPDPSVIAGRVQANGGVAIVNQSGMVFAGGAQVNVGSLIASAAGITNENFMAGRMAFDQAARPGARVENHGTITVADRGLAALVGPGVSNSGVIRARLGRVALGAAETFVLDLAGDGLIGIDVTQAVRTAPEGGQALVTNSGVIEAAGGSVLITAHAASGLVEDLVRQTGRIEAPTVGTRTGDVAIRAEGGGVRVDGRVAATGGANEVGGRIALQATGTVTAGATARIDASGGAGGGQVLVGTTGRGRNQTMAARTIVERGAEIRADATGSGNGGMLVLNSLERTEMRGTLSARGGPSGGNGGFVELSGQGALVADGTIDVRAPAGVNGELLIDPQNIIVSDSATPTLPSGDTVTSIILALDAPPTGTGIVTASTGADTEWTRISTAAIAGFEGTVTLDAARDITVASAIDKANGGLTLLAGRDVTIGASVTVSGDFAARAATGTITVNAPVTAGTGQTLMLRADTMAFGAGGSLSAPTGTIAIGPQTAGRNLQVGGSAANTLVLAAAPLDAATAGALRLGATTLSGLGTVTAGNVDITTDLTRPAGSSLDLVSGGTLTVNAAVAAGSGATLTLRADTMAFGAGSSLSAPTGTIAIGPQTEGRNLQVGGAGANRLLLGTAPLDAATTGTLVLGATTLSGLGTVTAGDVDITAALTRPAGSSLDLVSGGTLTVDAAVAAGSGATLTLRADTIGIGNNGSLSAASGIVEIGPQTAGRDLRVGNNAGNTLVLAAADLNAITTGRLRLGETTVSGIGTVTAGDVTIAAALTRPAGSGLEIVAGGNLTVSSGMTAAAMRLAAGTGTLDIGANLRATSLDLSAGTAIDQTGGNIFFRGNVATQLAVTAVAGNGAVSLDNAGNGNFALGPSSATAGFTVAADTIATTGAISGTAVSLTADTGALTIGADIRATGLTLAGAAGINQTGGTIQHSTDAATQLAVTANATGGNVSLAQADNGNLALGASAASGTFTVAADTLSTTGTVSGTAVSLTADTGALTLGGDIRATSLTLAGEAGISQTGGDIRHSTGATTELALTANAAAGAVDLSQPGNGTLALGASTAGGAFTVVADALRTTGAVEGTTVTLTADTGALTIGADIRATALALSGETGVTQSDGSIAHVTAGTELALTANAANGAVLLDGAGNDVFALGASTANAGLTVAAESLRVTDTVSGTAVALTARTGAIALEGDVRATGLTLTAATGIGQTAGTIANRAGASTGLDLAATVTGTGDVALTRGNGALALLSGGTADGGFAVTSAEGISLKPNEVLSVAGAASLTVQGNNNTLTLDGAIHAQSVALVAAGDITQGVDGVLAFRNPATGLAARATALDISAEATGNNHDIVLSGGNGRLRVTGATTADGDITMRARDLDIAGTITANASGGGLSNVTLTAYNDAGTGNLAMGATAAITAQSLALNAQRAITQNAAASIALDGGAGRLTVRGGAGGNSRAGSLSLLGSNSIGEVDLRTVATPAGVFTGVIEANVAGNVSVIQANGASVALTAGGLTVAAGQNGVTSTGDVRLVADALAINAGVTAATGGTLTLRGDRLSVGGAGSLSVADGTLEIGPRTAARVVQVGGAADPARLQVAAAALEGASAATIRLGRTTEPGTGTVTGAGVIFSEALALGSGVALEAVGTGAIAVDAALGAGSLRLNAGTAITLGAVDVTASGTAGQIELRAGGAITQAAGGALAATGGTADLVAHAGVGGITLAGRGDFRLADGGTPSGAAGPRSLYATGSIAFATDGALTVATAAEAAAPGATLSLTGASMLIEAPLITPGTSGTVLLTATGAGQTISQTAAGTITANLLTATADGAILLDQAPNAVASLGTFSFRDAFGYRTNTSVTIGSAVAPVGGGNADITFIANAGNLTLNAPISAGTGTVRLEATTGNIQQAAADAAITAGRLEVTAGGSALLAPTLPADRNAVAVLGPSTVGGTLAFNAAGDLALDGAIAHSGAGGLLQVSAVGTLTLNAGASLGFGTITLTTPEAMTLRGTVGVTGGSNPSSIVRLGAGGDITQEAGGIRAAALGLRSDGAVDLTAGTNDVRAIAALAAGTFAIDTIGALTTTTITGVPFAGGGVGDVSGVRGSSVTLSAADLSITPSTALFGEGVAATAVGGVVRLRADRLAVSSYVLASDPFAAATGTIDIAPRSPTRDIRLGGVDDPASLFLSAGTFPLLFAQTLVVGHDSPTSGVLRVGGPITTSFPSNATLHGGSIALDSTFNLQAANGLLTLHATSGDIVQGAAGSVSATRLSAIADAGSVLMGSPGALNSVGQVSGGVAAGESFVFRANGGYAVAAPGIAAAGAEVDLSSATGGITQTTGARITADRLRVTAPGTVALDGGGSLLAADLNAVGRLAPSSGASLTLRNATALTVEGATATAAIGGAVTLEGPGLTLAGDITANAPSGRAVLRTGASFDAPAAGTITQDAGIIRTQGLSASAGGDITLGGANQVVRLLAGLSAGGATSTNAVLTAPGGTVLIANSLSDLQVGARVNAGTGGAISVLANGLSVTFPGTAFLAPGGVVQFAPFTAGGTIGLGGFGGFGDTTTISAAAIQQVQTGRLIIGALEPFDQVSSGTITLRGAVDLTGASAPQALELRSGGNILADGFALSVPQLSAYAAGDIAIGTTGSRIGAVVAGSADGTSGIAAGGTSVRLVTAGADFATGLFTLSAPITTGAGGTIALQAPDFALLAGASVDTGAGAPGRIEIRSTRTLSLGGDQADAGTVRLTAAELALLDANGGTLFAAAPDIRLRGAWTLDPADATRLELALTPGGTGSITQVAGGLSAGALFVTALQGAGTVQIAQAGNDLPVVGVQALGGINVATEGALEVRRTTSSGGGVTYRATDITLSDAGLAPGQVTIDNTGRAVTLTATAGDITGTTAQAAVRANTLTATAAAGEIRLTGDNTVNNATLTANDGVTLRATGATAVGAVGAGGPGTEVAGAIDIAAAALTLNDVLGSGTVTLRATTGDLVQAADARLSAATLSAEAAGTLRLAGANPDGTARNTIQDLTALSAGGDITLRNALALTLDLPVSVGTDRTLTLEASGLTLANTLSAAGPNGQIILRTGSFNGGAASGGDITQTGGTISAANLAALAGGSVTIDLAGNAIGALGGGRDANGVALGLGLNAGAGATLRSNGFGGSATLGVTGALQVGTGQALTLRADDLAIGAQLRAPGGVITLLPITTDANIGYVLGGAAGSATAGRITLDSTELGFLPSGTPAAELRLGQIGQTGSVGIAGTVDLVDGAAPRVGRLTLAGDGALTQATGTLLDVPVLSANFPNGAVLLDPGVAGNRIGALAGVTAGGDVVVRGGAGLMELRAGTSGSAIEVPNGANILLRADDLDIQAALRAPAGVIRILPETPGRGVTLGGPDAAAGTLALGTAEIARIGGAGDTGALRLVIGSDGTVRSAGDILVAGDVPLRAGGVVRVDTLELVAGQPGTAGGSVRQSAGTVDVATITGTAQGDFELGRATNLFGTATGIAAGTLPVAGATGRVVLGAAGDLEASAITAPVSARITAGGALTAGGIIAPAITLGGNTVTLAGLVQGSTSVAIDSAGSVSQEAGALIVTGLFTLNGGSVSLPEDNQIVELGGLVATGPVLALNTVLPLLVSGTVSATGSLSLSTDQGLTVTSGGSIGVTGGPGTATLVAGGAINYAGGLSASGPASLTAGGALGFSGAATAGGALTFAAGTTATLGGTIGTGATFLATAPGAITTTATIGAAGDATLAAGGSLSTGGRIESTGGDLLLTAGGALSGEPTLVAARDATLRASGGPINLAGSLVAGRAASLEAAGALASNG